jgi:hypothetical protein
MSTTNPLDFFMTSRIGLGFKKKRKEKKDG